MAIDIAVRENNRVYAFAAAPLLMCVSACVCGLILLAGCGAGKGDGLEGRSTASALGSVHAAPRDGCAECDPEYAEWFDGASEKQWCMCRGDGPTGEGSGPGIDMSSNASACDNRGGEKCGWEAPFTGGTCGARHPDWADPWTCE